MSGCNCPMCRPGPVLLPCPFCGSADVDPAGWASTERSGPACNNCSGSADSVELWNSRPVLWTTLPPLGDSRVERVARLAQMALPLCNDGWELE